MESKSTCVQHFGASQKEKATETAIGKAGGCDGILTAVQRHSKDSDVLDQGLGALWSLAGEAQNRVLIVMLGV